MVLVALMGCWLGYQLNWVRQRHSFLERQRARFVARNQVDNYDVDARFLRSFYGKTSTPAPWQLRLFGEPGQVEIRIWIPDRGPSPDVSLDKEWQLGQSLFPEARITTYLDP